MELDDQARRILSLARDERTPDAEDKARIERRVALALGVTLAASGTASVASSTAAAAQSAAAQSAAAQSAAAQSAAAQSAAAQSTAGTVALKAAGTTGMLKGLIGGGALLVVAAASYAALSSGAPLSKAAPTAKAPQAVAIAAPAPAPTAPVAAPAAVAIPEPEPTQPAEHSAQARQPRAHEARLHARATSLADVELLHQAQAAWRERDARRALGLLDEHRELYPRSQMQLERDALRVLTLCELGRKADAAQLAQRLLARAPRSPLRSSIEESCALK